MKWNLNTKRLLKWGGKWMATAAWAVGLWLLAPGMAHGQSVGQVACPRSEGYVYLYSDMTTLDVRTTLQCGEQVEVTGRYDKFFGVRTSKGDTGYLPSAALLLVKDKPGPNAPLPTAAKPRPRIAYDAVPAAPTAPPVDASKLTLPNGTPIRMKLSKAVSTATAHVGDQVQFEVMEDVVVEGLCVIRKGVEGTGTVTDSEQKKRMGLGHGAKLGVLVNSVRLSDNEKAPARSYQDASGASGSAGSAMPIASGKDIVFPQGMEFQAFVDGDMQLKREAFQTLKSGSAPASAAQNPPPPHKR
jgi:hypothetical protein